MYLPQGGTLLRRRDEARRMGERGGMDENGGSKHPVERNAFAGDQWAVGKLLIASAEEKGCSERGKEGGGGGGGAGSGGSLWGG